MVELKTKVKKLIEKYEKIGDSIKLQKLYLIDKIFKKDKCFFEMSPEVAYQILDDLEIEDKDETYKRVMSFQNYVENTKWA